MRIPKQRGGGTTETSRETVFSRLEVVEHKPLMFDCLTIPKPRLVIVDTSQIARKDEKLPRLGELTWNLVNQYVSI